MIRRFFTFDTKGMEMGKLISILLAIALLLFILWWYSDLGSGLDGLFDDLLGLG